MQPETKTCEAIAKSGARCRSTNNLVDGLCQIHNALREGERNLGALKAEIDEVKTELARLSVEKEKAHKMASEPPSITPAELLRRAIKAVEIGSLVEAQTLCQLSAELRQVIKLKHESDSVRRSTSI